MKKEKGLIFIFLSVICLNFASAFIVNHTSVVQFDSLTMEQTDRVRQLNWLFGHQSTGRYILGVMDMSLSSDPRFDISIVPFSEGLSDVTTNDFLNGPIFGNYNVDSMDTEKFSEFFSFWNANYGLIDVGMGKYCFIDLNYYTDNFETAQDAYGNYTQALNSFRALHPDAVMIHFTMPLTSETDFYEAERSKYRDMILQNFGSNPNEYVFDIADIESWYNNQYSTFIYNGQTYLRMNPAYTSDTGHPDLGEAKVNLAKAMWVMLAKVAEDLAGVTPPAVDTDVNDDGKTNVIDAALISFWQGKDSGDADWSSYSHLDVDKDYDIDFRDVVEAVKKIL